jgi:hypothetical protein
MVVDIQQSLRVPVLPPLQILVEAGVVLMLREVALNQAAPVALASLLFVTPQILTPRHQ